MFLKKSRITRAPKNYSMVSNFPPKKIKIARMTRANN
jgi:hypothetical protein